MVNCDIIMLCSICLNPQHENSERLTCGHLFHKLCIQTSIYYSILKCPLCRKQIERITQRELCPERFYREDVENFLRIERILTLIKKQESRNLRSTKKQHMKQNALNTETG